MKVCIFGAGAIGGWIGANLAKHGHVVSMVARGDNLKAIQANGLTLTTSQGSAFTQAVFASASASDIGVQDLVIVCVKAQAMPEVAKAISPLLGKETIVLSAMNGVPWWFFDGFGGKFQGTRLSSIDPIGNIANSISTQHIIGCVVHASCSAPAPGKVHQHFGNKLIVGEPNGSDSPRLRALIAALSAAGFEAVQTEEIQKEAWYKLWGNMTINPISAITGATTDKILNDDLVRGFVSSIMLEAKAIGACIGIPIAQQPSDRHAVTAKLGAFKPSMLQDVEAGKSIELDALVTVVKELGQLTQVPTPFTDALLGLSRLFARQRGLY